MGQVRAAIGKSCIAAIAWCVLVASAVQVQADGPTSSEATIADLERQVELAYLDGDRAFLETVLHPEFRFTHGSGTTESRAETLAGFASGGKFSSRELVAIDVEVHENAALSVGHVEIVTIDNSAYMICYVRLYLRSEGAPWQLASHRTFKFARGHEESCFAG